MRASGSGWQHCRQTEMHSSALGLQPDRPLLTSLRRLSRPTTPLIEHCRRCHAETAANCHANAIRRQPAPVAVEARGDDHAAAPPVAGIPVSVDQSTAVGERLWTALQRHPHEFVPLVVVELQQVRLFEHCRSRVNSVTTDLTAACSWRASNACTHQGDSSNLPLAGIDGQMPDKPGHAGGIPSCAPVSLTPALARSWQLAEAESTMSMYQPLNP